MSTTRIACIDTEPALEGEATEQPSTRNITEQVYQSVAMIDANEWNRVREPEDIFLNLRLLQALETSMAATCRFRYALYRNGNGAPVAIAVLCTFTIDIGVLANDQWSKWGLAQLRNLSRKLVEYRILFCGLPLSACQSSLRITQGIDSRIVLAKLDRTLRRFAKEDRASVIVLKEFADEELPELKSLEELNYRKADSLPTHFVPLTSCTFEGYLQDIGKKKRHHIRQSMKKFAESGLALMTTSDLETIERLFTNETYRLYEAVLNRSTTQLERLPPEFFIQLARQLPDCCEFQFVLDGERVVGFCISLRTERVYRPLFVGLDYDINRDADLYFNLLFRTIADGAGYGATAVEIGQNSDYFKRTKLGAIQSARSIYVRGSSELMNWVIRLLFKQLFPARPLASKSHSE